MPLFSFLLPTRGRPDLVNRFFKSIVETTHHLHNLEIVLAVDKDDILSQKITHDKLDIKKVVLPPGSTMGRLNQACFKNSSGRYVMLINDDVILQTKDWDLKVEASFSQFEDEIGLIHVNDLLFQEKLCTFPFMSRKACLEIGVCPTEYKRYRIDDHIYDTYSLLAYLGHRRIVYLPEVIFEHDNHQAKVKNPDGHYFKSSDNKVYVPDPQIIKPDALFFDRTLEKRKTDALKLAHLIEHFPANQKESRFRVSLKQIKDSYSYRKSGDVQVISFDRHNGPPKTASVTIAVVTSGLQKEHAQKCLASIKKHTSNFDLVILDNNDGKNFNHPREMNKVLGLAKTDYVVLMDDDVYVEEGWLEGLLRAMDEKTGVVAPLHQDGNGKLSFSGAYLLGDEFGTHQHHTDIPDEPRAVQCLCSAILLVDMKKCGKIRFNENYDKYFLDIAHSLEVWESGFQTVCTPEVTVTHLGGGTLPQGSQKALLMWNKDLQIFIEEWADSGRFSGIQRGIWSQFPFLKQLVEIPETVCRFLENDELQNGGINNRNLDELIQLCRPHILFLSHLVTHLKTAAKKHQACGNLDQAKLFEKKILKLWDVPTIVTGYYPVLLESFAGYNLVSYKEDILAVPCAFGEMNLTLQENRKRPGIIYAKTVEQAKEFINRSNIKETEKVNKDIIPQLIREGFQGYNVVKFQKIFYAAPQHLGSVDFTVEKSRKNKHILLSTNLADLEKKIEETINIPKKTNVFISIDLYLSRLKRSLDKNFMNNKIYTTKIRPFLRMIYLWNIGKIRKLAWLCQFNKETPEISKKKAEID